MWEDLKRSILFEFVYAQGLIVDEISTIKPNADDQIPDESVLARDLEIHQKALIESYCRQGKKGYHLETLY